MIHLLPVRKIYIHTLRYATLWCSARLCRGCISTHLAKWLVFTNRLRANTVPNSTWGSNRLGKGRSPSEGNAPGTNFPFFSPFKMCGTELHSYLTLEASSPLPNPTESSQATVSLPIYEREINNCGSKPLRFGSCYAALSQQKTQNILRNILIRKLLCGFLPGRPKPHS